jgi:hypothetical protein
VVSGEENRIGALRHRGIREKEEARGKELKTERSQRIPGAQMEKRYVGTRQRLKNGFLSG